MLATLKVLLVVAILVQICVTDQPYNFDYGTNGQDWTGDCASHGTKQSPIELPEAPTANVPNSYLFGDFSSANGTVYFFNTTIYLNTSDSFGSIYTSLIDGNSVPFKANEIRIRVHSEHKTTEKYYDLQLQIFHTELYLTTRNYRFAVALFFDVSQYSDPFIQKVIDAYQSAPKSEQDIKNVDMNVDLGHLFTKNMIDNFWYYVGSPTMPNCRNGQINWVVYKKVYSITQQQLDKITDILRGSTAKQEWKGNWRKIQDINGNKIGYRQIGVEL